LTAPLRYVRAWEYFASGGRDLSPSTTSAIQTRVAACNMSASGGRRLPVFLQHEGHSRLLIGNLLYVVVQWSCQSSLSLMWYGVAFSCHFCNSTGVERRSTTFRAGDASSGSKGTAAIGSGTTPRPSVPTVRVQSIGVERCACWLLRVFYFHRFWLVFCCCCCSKNVDAVRVSPHCQWGKRNRITGQEACEVHGQPIQR
jgi:hypothetical protein